MAMRRQSTGSEIVAAFNVERSRVLDPVSDDSARTGPDRKMVSSGKKRQFGNHDADLSFTTRDGSQVLAEQRRIEHQHSLIQFGVYANGHAYVTQFLARVVTTMKHQSRIGSATK